MNTRTLFCDLSLLWSRQRKRPDIQIPSITHSLTSKPPIHPLTSPFSKTEKYHQPPHPTYSTTPYLIYSSYSCCITPRGFTLNEKRNENYCSQKHPHPRKPYPEMRPSMSHSLAVSTHSTSQPLTLYPVARFPFIR